MTKIKFIRAGDELSKKVKDVKLDGLLLGSKGIAVHYADLEMQYVVVWDDLQHNAVDWRSRDLLRVLHGDVEIVWLED